MRERFSDGGDIGFLCQGEDQITTLVRQFAARPADLPVRHPHALAGRRRARARPASSSSSTGSRSRAPTTRCRRRARRPSRGWAATASWPSPPPTPRCGSSQGAGPAHPPRRRPRRGRLPRLPHDDRAVCRVPPALAAAVLADHRPRAGARRAQAARRDGGAAGAGARAGAARASPAPWSARSIGAHRRGRGRAPPSGGRRPAARRVGPHGGHRRARLDRGVRRGAARRRRARAVASTSSPRASSCPPTSWRPGSRASASRPTARPPCPSVLRQ